MAPRYARAVRGGGCVKPVRFKVLVAEKPKAAEKIAAALASQGSGLRKCKYRGVPYWIVFRNGEIVVIAPSAGHLFAPTSDKRGFPVFDLVWRPIFMVEKDSGHLRKFYDMLSHVVPGAVVYVNACDYDIEGSVIGYKIIEAFGDVRRALRMKFSSLSKTEILRAYSNLQRLDREMVEAGLARNEMDWLWGINISRALMEAARRAVGRRYPLSAGRVQSPTLVEAARRWVNRNTAIPLPEIRVSVELASGLLTVSAHPYGWKPSTKAEALALKKALVGTSMVVVDLKARREVRRPPPPFNLGDLQAEAARIYKFSPMRTQSIAEDLYMEALISYPRTNSQKLPPTLNYRSLMNALLGGPHDSLVRSLLAETRGHLKPVQGPKDDPAHPAIHPIDYPRGQLGDAEWKIYDLVVRRFLASFSHPAEIEHVTVVLRDVKGRLWSATGVRVVKEGWMKYYYFSKPKEKLMPRLRRGDRLKVRDVKVIVEWVGPSVKLDKLSLLKWMESVEIGTESTRARIIEKLFKMGYLSEKGRNVEVTDLGMIVAEILETLFPELSTPHLTREFEKMLDDIRFGRRSKVQVLAETRKKILELLEKYKARLPQVEEKLAYVLGAREPPVKCSLCGREAYHRVSSVSLCRFHLAAACNLAGKLETVAERLGVSIDEALAMVAKRRGETGKWAVEVALAALKNPSLKHALVKGALPCAKLFKEA